MDDIVIDYRHQEDDNQYLPAFARDVIMRKHSSVQSPHWTMLYHPDDVSGDVLTIKAIAPWYDVQAVMKLLTDAISKNENNR